MADTSFRNCANNLRPWLISKGVMTVDTTGKIFNKVRELTADDYNLLVSEKSAVFKKSEIDSCLKQMRYAIPLPSNLLSTLTFGLAGNETPVDPTKPFSLNIEVDVVPDNAVTKTPGKVVLGRINTKQIEMNDSLKSALPINSETPPKELLPIINAGQINEGLLTAFKSVYNVNKSNRQGFANTINVFNKDLSVNKNSLRDNALNELAVALKKIDDGEKLINASTDPSVPKGIFHPAFKQLLVDLQEYIYNKGVISGKYTENDNFGKDDPEIKNINYWNFNYKREIDRNTESLLFRLTENLKRMTFVNTSQVANWYSNITSNDRKTYANFLKDTLLNFYYPGWTSDKEQAGLVQSSLVTNRQRKAYFEKKALFYEKMLTTNSSSVLSAFSYNKNKTTGGKHTRKHQKSKTQKAGRKNKKTRKH